MMRKQEIKEAFSQLHASDDLVKEVIALKSDNKTNSQTWRMAPWAAVCAAVFALVMAAVLLWFGETEPDRQLAQPTAPVEKEIIETAGVLKLYACEAQDMDSIQLDEYLLIEGMEPSYKTAWSPVVNLLTAGVTLTLLVDEESLMDHEITYDVSVNYGELRDSIYNTKNENSNEGKHIWGKKHTAVNGETIRWVGNELYFERPQGTTLEALLREIDKIQLDIIIKADGCIVGYAVLEMICTDIELCIFHAVLVGSGYFPKVDGKFQNVGEEYVNELIKAKMISQAM